VRVVIGALRQNPNLAKCTPISFIGAVMQSIQLGLEPNTVLGHAYIIPYWNSKMHVFEAEFMRGYRGLVDMAYRTGQFADIYAQEVDKGDFFEFKYGTRKYLDHIPIDKPKLDKKDNPIMIYVYAGYENIKGGKHFAVWTKEKLDRHKERYSPAVKKDKFSAWNVSEMSMYKKTVLKDALNYADVSVEFRKELQTDAIVKREIKPNMIDTVKPVYEFSPDDLKGMDDVKLEGEKETKEKPTKKKQKEKSGNVKLVTEKQIKRYYAIAKEAGIDIDKADERIKAKYEIDHKRELTMEQLDEIFQALENKIAKRKSDEKIGDDFDRENLAR